MLRAQADLGQVDNGQHMTDASANSRYGGVKLAVPLDAEIYASAGTSTPKKRDAVRVSAYSRIAEIRPSRISNA